MIFNGHRKSLFIGIGLWMGCCYFQFIKINPKETLYTGESGVYSVSWNSVSLNLQTNVIDALRKIMAEIIITSFFQAKGMHWRKQHISIQYTISRNWKSLDLYWSQILKQWEMENIMPGILFPMVGGLAQPAQITNQLNYQVNKELVQINSTFI